MYITGMKVNKNKLWIQAAFLLSGTILGFFIGRITFGEKPIDTAAPTQQTQALPVQGTESITPKAFESVTGVSPDDDPRIGKDDAKLMIVEFTDYQCPFCKDYFEGAFQDIRKNYVDTGKVQYVLRDFPLDIHPQAVRAAEVASCAGEQDKYWEMHDTLFTEQDNWSFKDDAESKFQSYAANLELNISDFNKCLDSGKYEAEIAKDIRDGLIYKVGATPAIFVGDKKITGAQDFKRTFKPVIEDELKKPVQQTQETEQTALI